VFGESNREEDSTRKSTPQGLKPDILGAQLSGLKSVRENGLPELEKNPFGSKAAS
jgi:hypothetical protein